MAAMESDYVRRENRKRALRSWGIALLVYFLLITAYWGWEHFIRKELTMNQGPVLVRLGEPEGAEEPTPLQPEEEPQAKPREEPEPPTPPEPKETPVEPPEEKPVLPALEETPETPKEEPKDVSPPVEETPPAPPEPIRGSEMGNNFELDSEGGEIGQNVWVPIYLYLPLPRYIDAEIDVETGDLVYFEDIIKDGLFPAEVNRAVFSKYYSKITKTRTHELKGIVPLDDRPEIWRILEESGYNVNNAEYKNLVRSKSITIHFSVVPSRGSAVNESVDVKIVSGTGIPDIDEAVLYAFQQSTYYTTADEPVKGRFTYRFY